uniref:Uncharacterized protein n=1 Tax=Parascaris univalens TaxID=6257 RepID=A0A914ZGY4_PARUN
DVIVCAVSLSAFPSGMRILCSCLRLPLMLSILRNRWMAKGSTTSGTEWVIVKLLVSNYAAANVVPNAVQLLSKYDTIHLLSEVKRSAMVYKAVLFDSTGVMMSYAQVPYLGEFMKQARKLDSVWDIWADLELGKMDIKDANNIFQRMLDSNPTLRKEVTNAMTTSDILSIFDNLTEDENFALAVPKIRSAGIRTCLLTNQMFRDDRRKDVFIPASVIAKFDESVISCRDGCRKPDTEIFLLAARKLGVDPQECIFIDDFAENCEGAKKVGMTAIRVYETDTKTAVMELEKLLQLELL